MIPATPTAGRDGVQSTSLRLGGILTRPRLLHSTTQPAADSIHTQPGCHVDRSVSTCRPSSRNNLSTNPTDAEPQARHAASK